MVVRTLLTIQRITGQTLDSGKTLVTDRRDIKRPNQLIFLRNPTRWFIYVEELK